MTDLYRNQLRLVLQGFVNNFGDISELYLRRLKIMDTWRNKYSDITIEEINKRINELDPLAT